MFQYSRSFLMPLHLYPQLLATTNLISVLMLSSFLSYMWTYLVPIYFHHHTRKILYILISHSLFPNSTACMWQLLLSSILDVSYTWNNTICDFLCLASFTYIFHVVVCSSTSFFLWLSDIPLYEFVLHFIHSLVNGHLGCFYLLNKALFFAHYLTEYPEECSKECNNSILVVQMG